MKHEGQGFPARPVGEVTLILLSSAAVGTGLHIFVLRAGFAPSGVDGLATMLTYLSGRWLGRTINMGVFTLLLNLPLLLLALRTLPRRFLYYTLVYTLGLSLSLLALEWLGVYQYDCLEGGRDPLIAAIFGGAAQGLTAIPLRLGGSSGGADIIGTVLAVRMPHRPVERLISYVSYLVILLSLPVFRDLSAVCLSAIAVFVCERVSAAILRPTRGALRFEIVAPPSAAGRIADFVMARLGHGVTVLSATGGYSGEERCVLVSLVGYRRLPELLAFLRREEEVFFSFYEAAGVYGRFRGRGEM